MRVRKIYKDGELSELDFDLNNWRDWETVLRHIKKGMKMRRERVAEGPDSRAYSAELDGNEFRFMQWDFGDGAITLSGATAPEVLDQLALLLESITELP